MARKIKSNKKTSTSVTPQKQNGIAPGKQTIQKPGSKPNSMVKVPTKNPFCNLTFVPLILQSAKRVVHVIIAPVPEHPASLLLHFLTKSDEKYATTPINTEPLSDADLHELFGNVGELVNISRAAVVDVPDLTSVKITFKDAAMTARALKLRSSTKALKAINPQSDKFKNYRDAFLANRPNESELQMEVDKYMAEFDAAEAKTEEDRKRMTSKPDADGFITVTSKKRGKTTADFESANAKRKKKRGTLERSDFYRFQLRENKQQRLEELQRKFEADKARIANIKASRQFKPY